MANNKIKRVTKPIGFRLEAQTVDAISKAAKDKGITIQDYFLSQIAIGSELHGILLAEQERMLMQSKNIANAREQMAQDALKIREQFGLSEDQFLIAITESVKMLIQPNKSDD